MKRIPRARRLIVLLSVSVFPLQAGAVARTWDGSAGDSNWSNPLNWSGNSVPNDGDTATINGPASLNAVRLTQDVTASPVDRLTLGGPGTTRNTLSTLGFAIRIEDGGAGLLTVEGDAAIAASVVSPNFFMPAVRADNIVVRSGGEIVTSFGGSVVSDGGFTIDSGGSFRGQGAAVVNTGGGFFNAGTIAVERFGSGSAAPTLTIIANGSAQLDLDGLFEVGGVATGQLVADFDDVGSSVPTPASLVIDGPLRDPFSGTATIGARDTLRFEDAWTLDGSLIFDGTPPQPSTFSPTYAVTLDGERLTVVAPPPGGPSTAYPPGLIRVTGRADAVFDADVRLDAGTLRLDNDTSLDLANDLTLNPAAALSLASSFRFINVRAGQSLRTFQAAPLDLDGTAGNAEIRVNAQAQLHIENDLTDDFNGTLILGAQTELTLNGNVTFASNASINKAFSGQAWNIGGNVAIAADVDLDGTPLIGNPFEGYTQINITRDDATLTLTGDIDPDGASVDFFRGRVVNSGTLTVERPGSARWALAPTATLDLLPEPPSAGGGITPVPAPPRVVGDALDNGGTITGTGQFDTTVTNFIGTLDPGRTTTNPSSGGTTVQPGRFDFINNQGLVLEEAGTLRLDLAGLAPGVQHDYIQAASIVAGGALQLELVSGFVPALYGDVLTLLHADVNDVDLVFHRVGGVELTGPLAGTALAVTYLSDAVQVQRVLVGDANRNGTIEQGDLDAVLNNWGSSNTGQAFPTISWATGDLTGDGFVDQADLDRVLNNWGINTAALSSNATIQPIPEPAVLLVGLLATATRRRRSV